MVAPEDQLFLIADSGVTIRVPVSGISEQGRDATGVRAMNLDDETHVVAVARVLDDEDEELDGDEGAGPEVEGVDADVVGTADDSDA